MKVFPFFFSSPLFYCHFLSLSCTTFAYCLGAVTSNHLFIFFLIKFLLKIFYVDHLKRNLYWICYNIASVLFLVFCPWGMWDLSSQIKDQTHTPLVLEDEVLTTELPGRSQNHMFKLQCSLIMITVWTSDLLRSFNDVFHAETTGRLEAEKGLVNFSQERNPMWWKFSEWGQNEENMRPRRVWVGWLVYWLFHLL